MSDCLSLRERVFAPGEDGADDQAWLAHLQTCAECRCAHQGLPLVDQGLAEVARQPVSIPSFRGIAAHAARAARAQRRRGMVRRTAPYFFTTLGAMALAAGVAFAVFVSGDSRPAAQQLAPGAEIQASMQLYRENVRRSTIEALNHGQFEAAEKQIGQLLGTDPDAALRAEAQALQAWSLSARGQRDLAITRYRQALELLPEGQRPLWAENACAELAILVQKQTPKDGPAIWSECLRRFPDGVNTGLTGARAKSGR